MKRTLYLTILSALAAVILLIGCAGAVVSGAGTVQYIDVEDGFYGIIGDDGENYDPINLTQEFQVDGLRVWFQANVREDDNSTHMWGKTVKISSIIKLPSGG